MANFIVNGRVYRYSGALGHAWVHSLPLVYKKAPDLRFQANREHLCLLRRFVILLNAMLKSILSLAMSAAGIMAQTIFVNTPAPGDTISASSPFTVEVQQSVR